jgi:hypothetical protein
MLLVDDGTEALVADGPTAPVDELHVADLHVRLLLVGDVAKRQGRPQAVWPKVERPERPTTMLEADPDDRGLLGHHEPPQHAETRVAALPECQRRGPRLAPPPAPLSNSNQSENPAKGLDGSARRMYLQPWPRQVPRIWTRPWPTGPPGRSWGWPGSSAGLRPGRGAGATAGGAGSPRAAGPTTTARTTTVVSKAAPAARRRRVQGSRHEVGGMVVASDLVPGPLVQLRLGDLDQVAAGVVEHRRRHATHVDRLLREPHAEAA